MANIEIGHRFQVFNGDAKGTVTSSNSINVSYVYDHDLETSWTRDMKEFLKNTYPIESKN